MNDQIPRKTLTIVQVDNGFYVTFLDPSPIIAAAKEAMMPDGPSIKTDDDIDRTIDAMIEFNKHMHSEIVDHQDWKDNDSKRALVREGFKLSFPQFFEKEQPHACMLMPQSLVFTKIEDLIRFLKSKL